TYTGLTTVSAGSLTYGIANAISSGDVTVNGSTAILALAGFSDTVGAVTLTEGSITSTTGVLTGTSYTLNPATGKIIRRNNFYWIRLNICLFINCKPNIVRSY
ncbi:MAG: hypothetical protein EBW51_08835, partial [Actinobacteria bacterium]|nr:hypothetical protein [Actinomycetota bacterium]